jgi:hypothetical protein
MEETRRYSDSYSVAGAASSRVPWPRQWRMPSHEKLTEPVALLSTQPADLPLPRTAPRRSFNLLALRARCEQEPTHASWAGQDGRATDYRTLRRFSNRASYDLPPAAPTPAASVSAERCSSSFDATEEVSPATTGNDIGGVRRLLRPSAFARQVDTYGRGVPRRRSLVRRRVDSRRVILGRRWRLTASRESVLSDARDRPRRPPGPERWF